MKELQKKFSRESEYPERVEKELNIIDEKGFVETYNQVYEVIQIAENRDIPHILRGSAASSYVAYLMEIHDIDPVEFNIPLERFLNWSRDEQPDFDIDFPYNRRDEIYKELRRRYPDRVARISNRVKYREKSALRQACKDFGVTGQIPRYFSLKDYFPKKENREKVKKRAEELEGKQKMWMRHCGGVVIFDDEVPPELIIDPEDNQVALDKDDVEDRGLIKVDILSNRGLAQLDELSDRKLKDYPFDDEKASNLICNGDNIGLTQAESRTMRKALLALQPQRMEEVALALALIRPAAAAGGRKFSYLKNYNSEGVGESKRVIYDEDAIKLIAEISGCSYSEADEYRRGFSDGDDEVIESFLDEISWRDDRHEIIEELLYLQKYSFAKGHALAYAQMVWALAYHKARDPHSFWNSTLEHCHTSYKKWVHMREAINSGVDLINSVNQDPIVQFKNSGWWDTGEFLPGMGVEKEDDRVYFKGVFGSFRKYYQYEDETILGMIGVGNKEYEDIVIDDDYPNGFYHFIEGWGKRKEKLNYSYIDVKEFYCSNPETSSKRTINDFIRDMSTIDISKLKEVKNRSS